MFNQLQTLQKLIRQLQRVPYLASKNIYRVASYFLNSDDKQVEAFCQAILEAKKILNLVAFVSIYRPGTIAPRATTEGGRVFFHSYR